MLAAGTEANFFGIAGAERFVDAMEKFNALPDAARGPQASWMAFADVKRLSAEVDARLDTWLQNNDVIVPSSIGVDFYEEPDGSLSFVPTSPSLDSSEFRTVFQRSAEAHDVYTIQRTGSERVRVVLSNRQKTVLERMKRVQRVRGEKQEELLKDPLQVFDGVAGDVELPPSYRRPGHWHRHVRLPTRAEGHRR